MQQDIPRAIVALGSNLGDSERILCEAMERLAAFAEGPVARSSLWRTSPVDCPVGSPVFVNAVVCFTPLLGETPHGLLAKLKAMEREFGREPKRVVNEPRPLDLDVIAWGRLELRAGTLILPHPRAHQRRFVLAPLVELAPDLVLPGQTRTVRQLLEALGVEAKAERIERL